MAQLTLNVAASDIDIEEKGYAEQPVLNCFRSVAAPQQFERTQATPGSSLRKPSMGPFAAHEIERIAHLGMNRTDLRQQIRHQPLERIAIRRGKSRQLFGAQDAAIDEAGEQVLIPLADRRYSGGVDRRVKSAEGPVAMAE